MDRTTKCGHGGSGNCFVVGVRDPGLAKTLRAHDVVFYVAKRMLTIDRWRISGHAEAVREMSEFPISHPAICAPVGGILDDESPTLLFPWWNGGHISHWISRERELRWTRTANGLQREPPSEEVMARYDTDMHLSTENGQFKPYPVGDRDPRAWVAPELTREKAYMTPRERSEYDDEMFAKGFPTGASLPHVVHGQRLREALDTMTTVNIANRIDHRRTAAHWETYFQEQLMVDPLVCQRPPETKPREKKHPDGPREIGKDKL
ncbi:hypothetical protein R1sor_016562 [Riccia sorocarpa]|uniref:Uncharacterized protein n=1 Tax=Riccia sorocarpa TaxID=122646 RepID=A0ABD3HFQ7_9MARC